MAFEIPKITYTGKIKESLLAKAHIASGAKPYPFHLSRERRQSSRIAMSV
jgi:hypothetical protein